MFSIEIQSVTCYEMGGSSKHADNVEIIVQTDGNGPARFPIVGAQDMDNDTLSSWDLTVNGTQPGQIYYFDRAVTIQLYDRDGSGNFVDSADPLASFYWASPDVGVDATDDTLTLRDSTNANDADYEITFHIKASTSVPSPDNGPLPPSLASALQDNLATWANSTAGKEIIAATDPQDLEDLLKEAILSETFSALRTELNSFTKVKGISLGVMANADLCFGITGAFGIALARDDFQLIGMGGDKDDLDSAIYAGGGLLEGADVELDGTLALGIWFVEPKDFSGRCVGVDADIGDVEDVEGVAYAQHSDDDDDELKTDGEYDVEKIRDAAKVTFVGMGIGIGGGADVQEAHFFAGALSGNTPCYQSGDYNHMAIVTAIRCSETISPISNDNVMLHYYVDGDCPDYSYDDKLSHNIYAEIGDPGDIPGQYRFPIWNSREIDNDSDTVWPAGPVIKFNTSFHIDLHADEGVPLEWDSHDNAAVIDIHHVTFGSSSDDDLSSPSDTCTKSFEFNGGSYEVDLLLLK